MSEQAPQERQNPYDRRPDTPVYRLNIEGGGTMEMHAQNSQLYRHTDQESGDHIFVAHEEGETGTIGTFLWRQGIGSETFEQIRRALMSIGVRETVEKYMTDSDRERFVTRFGYLPDIKEPPTYELTPRLEALVRHFGEIATNAPPDVFYDALTTPQRSDLPMRWIREDKVIDQGDSGAF